MNKTILILIAIIMVIVVMPTTAVADSYDGAGTVVIDTAPTTTLQAAVEAALGGHPASNVTHLTITSDVIYTMTSADIWYIQGLTGLTHLHVADTVSVDANGDGAFGDIGSNFFSNNSTLVDVTFPGTSFGDNAFYYCGALTSVNMPSATTFGNYAFFYSNSLANIDMPSATTFGDAAFGRCSSLTSVSLSSATTFGHLAFGSCEQLTAVSLPAATTFGDNIFFQCTQPIEWTLGNTVPSISTTQSYAKPTGAKLIVPFPVCRSYDNDANDTLGESYDDTWFGWPLNSPYTITATAGDDGSISPEGVIPVANGADQSFDITPNSGYKIKDVKVDGISRGEVSWYQFCSVSKDHTITAEFEEVPVTTPEPTPTPTPSPSPAPSETPLSPDTQYGSITIFVTNANGNELAGYPVELHSKVITTVTDANGKATFTNIPLVDHTLVVLDASSTEIGCIELDMQKCSASSSEINSNEVSIAFTENTVSVEVNIKVDSGGSGITVDEVTITENPVTGSTIRGADLWWGVIILVMLIAIAAFILLQSIKIKS